MTTQFIINAASEKVLAVIPFAEYQSLLELAASIDETAFLLREPKGSLLGPRMENVKQGSSVQYSGYPPPVRQYGVPYRE